MNELIISLLMFVVIFAFVIVFLHRGKEFSSFHYALYIVLLISWMTMFMFKTNPHIESRGFIGKSWWSWPLIISLYQFTQVIFRLPIGIMAKKLVSRKIPVMMVMFILLIGLVLVVSSNFADWAIVIGIITAGIMGATFGLDAQYWSENWNIKKGFLSAIIIFTIPFLARQMSKFINFTFIKIDINLFWVTFIAIALLTVTLIFYALKVKEDKSTIFIDNMNPKAIPFENKSMYDVFVNAFSASLVTASFTFLTYIGAILGNLSISQKLIFPFAQIIFVILTPMLLLKFIKVWNLSLVANALLFTCSIILTILLITNTFNAWSLILLISLINSAFGIYIILMFGATLHFDHKFPALVMGIFLTVKSFFTGSAELSSTLLLKHTNLSINLLGWIAFGTVVSLNLISFIIANHNFLSDKKINMNKAILQDSYKYENSW